MVYHRILSIVSLCYIVGPCFLSILHIKAIDFFNLISQRLFLIFIYTYLIASEVENFSYFYWQFHLFFALHRLFVAVPGLSLVTESRAALHCGAWASHRGSLSCCGAQALDTGASVVVAGRSNSCSS